MTKRLAIWGAVFGLTLLGPRFPSTGETMIRSLPPLHVSASGRRLVRSDDGSPFFWLADTAWHLVNLAPAEATAYLQDRAQKGFTVIQGPILLRKPFLESGLTTNFAGEVALLGSGPDTVLNEAYMRHVDFLVDEALRHRLYIAPAVIWGPVLDQIFAVQNPDHVRNIGIQLGRRYRNKPNVIWIVCGEYHKIAWETKPRDRTVPTAGELNLIHALAEGLETGHAGANLMTVHPDGGRSSSQHFHAAAWLDFNMIQTFEIKASTAMLVSLDRARVPAKPVVNAEPAYEDRNRGFVNDPATAWKVRYEAYHALFQGAMGHTYGHWDIWQFAPAWRDAMNSEGAQSMAHMRALIESRPTVVEPLGATGRLIVGSRFFRQTPFPQAYTRLRAVAAVGAPDGSSALIYFPGADLSARIDLDFFTGTTLHAWWFNPADGRTYTQTGEALSKAAPFGKFTRHTRILRVNPPGSGAQQDWILVLDDAAKGYGPPGQARPHQLGVAKGE